MRHESVLIEQQTDRCERWAECLIQNDEWNDARAVTFQGKSSVASEKKSWTQEGPRVWVSV